jgi:hypothetical protein
MFEQAVIVHLKLSNDEFGTAEERDAIHTLCNALERVIESTFVGEFDGDEFGEGQCSLYMYGDDADALFAAVEPLLRASRLSRRGYAVKRYGDASDPSAREVRVDF